MATRGTGVRPQPHVPRHTQEMAESLSQDSWVSNRLGLREQGVRTLVQTALSRGSPHYSPGQGLGGTSPLSSLGRVSSWGYRSQSWEMCTLKVGEIASAGAQPCYVGSHGLPFPLLSWGGTCLRRSFARIRDASVSCNQMWFPRRGGLTGRMSGSVSKAPW